MDRHVLGVVAGRYVVVRWLAGVVLAVTVTLAPRAALAAPLTLQFDWNDDPATVFSLAVLQGSWPSELEAFVALEGSGLDVGTDPWCSSGGAKPGYAPADASFAFCSSFLETFDFDQLQVGGSLVSARLYLGTADSVFDVYTELRAPGQVVVDYPIPEPAAPLLVGAGLIGLGAMLRWRMRRLQHR